MKREDLNEKYGLYKTIDLTKDTRVNIFCKAGGGFIFFTLLIIGFFIDNFNFLFPFSEGYTLFIQYGSVILGFVLYAFIHELIHYLTAKAMHIKAHFIRDGLYPFATIKEEVITKKQYFTFALMPFIILTTLLIPTVILIKIFASSWFWLPYIILMQNMATSIGDFVAIFYVNKYKDVYIEDDDIELLVFIPIDNFKEYHDKEQAYYEKKWLKKQRKKERKKQLRNAPKMGKKLYEDSLKEKQNQENPAPNPTPTISEDNEDIDDLKKLDM